MKSLQLSLMVHDITDEQLLSLLKKYEQLLDYCKKNFPGAEAEIEIYPDLVDNSVARRVAIKLTAEEEDTVQ